MRPFAAAAPPRAEFRPPAGVRAPRGRGTDHL